MLADEQRKWAIRILWGAGFLIPLMGINLLLYRFFGFTVLFDSTLSVVIFMAALFQASIAFIALDLWRYVREFLLVFHVEQNNLR